MDFYKILGLPRDATLEEIREAYFSAARTLHPDANPEPDAKELFLSATEAYETLINPDRKFVYDQKLPPALPPPELKTAVYFSRKSLLMTKQPQLFYTLFDLRAPIEPEKNQNPPVFICLVIDCSTSMQGDRLDMIKSGAASLLKQLRPQDWISVVTFNDRAEVLIPPIRVAEINRFENRISSLRSGGGTELFRGLQCGFDQMLSFRGMQLSRYLVLLTDGHTYGDEIACMNLAGQAVSEKISIIALGIGHEWNDAFLDRLTAVSGGNTYFIRNINDLNKVFGQKLSMCNQIYAKGLRMEFYLDPHVTLKYAFRIQPDGTHLGDGNNFILGDLVYGSNLSVLLEFMIKGLPEGVNTLDMLQGKIWLDVVDRVESKSRFYLDIKVPVLEKPQSDSPPREMLEALSVISLYRLQEKARVEVSEGKIEQATRHLQYLATNMLSLGKRAIAHEILLEAEHIQKNHSYSPDGEKRLKYGTRALMLPSGMEEN